MGSKKGKGGKVKRGEARSCTVHCAVMNMPCMVGWRRMDDDDTFNIKITLLPYEYSYKTSLPDRIKPSFVIFDIRAL